MSAPSGNGGLLHRASRISARKKSSDAKLQGLESPGYLFKLFKDRIEFDQGAFLLYDREHESYSPWAQSGLDTTTSRRLRIARNLIESQLIPKTGKLYENEELESWKGYLSIRTASLIDNLFILPFFEGKAITGILLILDAEEIPDTSDLCLKAADILKKSSLHRLNDNRTSVYSFEKESPIGQIDHLCLKLQEEKQQAQASLFDLRQVFIEVVKKYPYLDRSRIEMNLLKLFKTMAGSNGKALALPEDTLLFIKKGLEIDPDILYDQIEARIQDLFSGLSERLFPLPVQSFPLPSEKDLLLSLL